MAEIASRADQWEQWNSQTASYQDAVVYKLQGFFFFFFFHFGEAQIWYHRLNPHFPCLSWHKSRHPSLKHHSKLCLKIFCMVTQWDLKGQRFVKNRKELDQFIYIPFGHTSCFLSVLVQLPHKHFIPCPSSLDIASRFFYKVLWLLLFLFVPQCLIFIQIYWLFFLLLFYFAVLLLQLIFIRKKTSYTPCLRTSLHIFWQRWEQLTKNWGWE